MSEPATTNPPLYLNKKWNHLRRILENPSPFGHPDFQPSTELIDFLMDSCRILVIGK